MYPSRPSTEYEKNDDANAVTQKLPVINRVGTGLLNRPTAEPSETSKETVDISDNIDTEASANELTEITLTAVDVVRIPGIAEEESPEQASSTNLDNAETTIDKQDTQMLTFSNDLSAQSLRDQLVESITHNLPDLNGKHAEQKQEEHIQNGIEHSVTQRLVASEEVLSPLPLPEAHPTGISRKHALLLISLLLIVFFSTFNVGSTQFMGAQGWAYVLGGPDPSHNPNVLTIVNSQIHSKPKPGATPLPAQQITPQQYINAIIQHMSLEQKLGQMLIVQFVGPSYSLDLSTMITQYNVGAVLVFAANNNIQDKAQLKDLIHQAQSNSSLPLAVAIDQEGGTVDRLISLDGSRPSAATIGTWNDSYKAMQAGMQDAKDLASYGFNLNLAPVVDVTNIYNPQLYLRTFGNNPTTVTKMAGAYLQGLQQSGKVVGTLKHFPGLGDVGADPHVSVPYLRRPVDQLNTIDWAPYRTLIAQGNVYSVMVTHEIVTALDSSKPSSLSYKVVTGILRQKLGFQGVIMTDSLTMDGITAYASEAQAAVLAVEAGDDLLMGASSPQEVGAQIQALTQAVTSGEISTQRIDDSVRRILMMKYKMGLLTIPAVD